jgi:membrane-associated phospholipid phosphatase
VSLHAWQLASLIFFVYLLVVAVLPRGSSRAARLRVVAGATAGMTVIGISTRLPADGIADAWLLPAAALLIGYWTSGCLFVSPMPRAERLLVRIDQTLRIDAIAAACPRFAAEVLEVAYTGVYPLIPLALYLSLGEGMTADRFWTTILLTDYICFGMLPWIQTRPPRALGFDTTWPSRWRIVNRRMLAASSVQVNTFPSGHAAEALVVALLLSGSPAPVAGAMFVYAAAISAGAVFGRYHYAADAIAGWIVAVIVYIACRPGR